MQGKPLHKLTNEQRTILDFIQAGMSDLGVIQAAAHAVGISENAAYWAAKYLRQNGYVKGRQAAPANPRPGGPSFQWTYHPLTDDDRRMQSATYEERKVLADKIIADWQGRNRGVKPPPQPKAPSDAAD